MDAAEALGLAAYNKARATLGDAHRITSAAQAYLGRIVLAQQRPDEALPMLAAAVEEQTARGDVSLTAFEIHLAYINALRISGQIEEAEQERARLRALALPALPPDHPLARELTPQ